MIPAEMQRILLLVALAATGYLLILAWTDDYHSSTPNEAAPYAEAPQPQGQVNSGVPSGTSEPADLAAMPDDPLGGIAPVAQTAGDQVAAGSSDVPDASLLDGESAVLSRPNVSTPDTQRLIEVSTPVLKVWIDRLGGDIVRVQLPKFPIAIDRPDVPFLLLENSPQHTYVAQTGLFNRDGIFSDRQRPLFNASAVRYEMGENDSPLVIELTTTLEGLQLVKRYEFRADDYLVDMSYSVANTRDKALRAQLFAQIKRDEKEPPGSDSFSLGPQPYLGGALTTPENRYEKLEFDDLEEDGPYRATVEGGWVAFLQHYFLSAWVATPDQSNQFYAQRRNDGQYVFGYFSPAQDIAPGAAGNWTSQFYAGPKDQKRLAEIAPNLNLTVDYGFLWWLAVPLFTVLDWFHGVVGNWGMAIVLLTLVVKLVLYPLSAAAYRSMANMRRVGPQLKRIQERYADDRQKLSQEMMGLYKKEGVNPLGGCLPMLLPMPIFLALYWVLYESVELRHAPFLLWINDLAAMDPWFVLPLLMGGSMFLQQQLSPQVGDPMQIKMMKMMPIMFTALFLFFPAGLVLYWLVNNVLSIAQQWYVIKQTEASYAAKG